MRDAGSKAVTLCFLDFRKRRCLQIKLMLAVSVIGLSLFTGCGSSSQSHHADDAGHQLGNPRSHYLWHGAERHAA